MTTDTRPKWAAARCRIGRSIIRILGCAKGAGMIEPRLATMLAFVVTDAAISPVLLRRALTLAATRSFNAITVDGDTSTNDTLAILANGASGARKIRSSGLDFNSLVRTLEKVCRDLSLGIVADGEGARRVLEIEVCGAPSARAAMQVARTIANSPLVKTAFAGADPNWGRILAAAGRSGIAFDPRRASVSIAGVPVCSHGVERRFSEAHVHHRMQKKSVPVVLNLGAGGASGCVWTCDFTGDYVRINASYRT